VLAVDGDADCAAGCVVVLFAELFPELAAAFAAFLSAPLICAFTPMVVAARQTAIAVTFLKKFVLVMLILLSALMWQIYKVFSCLSVVNFYHKSVVNFYHSGIKKYFVLLSRFL